MSAHMKKYTKNKGNLNFIFIENLLAANHKKFLGGILSLLSIILANTHSSNPKPSAKEAEEHGFS